MIKLAWSLKLVSCPLALLPVAALALEAPERGFVSTRPADHWEEALICGNGSLGALVHSRPLVETITFCHERLFMPWFPKGPVVELAPHLPEIRRLIASDRYREAARLTCEVAEEQGYDDMWWTDPLIPAFDLRLTMPRAGDVSQYVRSVDFATGVASVEWRDDRGRFTRRLFVSRADGVAVLAITSDARAAVDCTLSLATTVEGKWPSEQGDEQHGLEPTDEAHEASEEQEQQEDEGEGDSYRSGICDVLVTAGGSILNYSSRFTRARPDSIKGHVGVARVHTSGGELQANNGRIEIRGANAVTVLLTLDVVDGANNPVAKRLAQKVGGIAPDFDQLLADHTAIHGEMFARVRLDLGGADECGVPSEELLAEARQGVIRPALLEKQFDAARYAVICSSGELPPTLQGVWTGTWSPPWQSDYTQNGNVPAVMASALEANLTECMESYLGYIESLVPDFRENARRLYGARGIMLPSRTSSHGLNTHFNEQFIHLFWTPGAAWASTFFYDYYQFTGDRQFLRDRAVPFMKEAALFLEDFLVEGDDGYYVFSPSYSPENTPANSDSQACVNATMDIALTKRLLKNLLAACEELGVEERGVDRWRAMLAKMPPYRVNAYGTVQEWTTPKLADNHEHRHISHLYALYDALPAEVEQSATLPAAFTRVIEDRMEPRRRQGGGPMSFGLVQLGQSAASLGEAELADEALTMLSRYYWRRNLASTHNPDNIFNVDICGGMPSVLIRMLLQSQPGRISVLPATPQSWESGTIEGLLCRGQVTVKRLAWEPNRVTVSLRSNRSQHIELRVGPPTLGPDAESDVTTVFLPKDETVEVELDR